MKRSELVERLNIAMETLYVSAKTANKKVAVFLHQSINKNADESTLLKIIKDVEKVSRKWMKH